MSDSAARTKSPAFLRKVRFPATSPLSPFSPSLKNRVVFLHKWWLIKTDPDSHGRRIGVGGLSSHGGKRRFRSAAIVKRNDSVTFQTLDDVTVLVHGCINRTETLQNGFPREVCDRFQIGFPYDWEEYACMSVDENEKPSQDCESGMLQQIFNRLMQQIGVKASDPSTVPISPTPVKNSRKRNSGMASDDILQSSNSAKEEFSQPKQAEGTSKASNVKRGRPPKREKTAEPDSVSAGTELASPPQSARSKDPNAPRLSPRITRSRGRARNFRCTE